MLKKEEENHLQYPDYNTAKLSIFKFLKVSTTGLLYSPDNGSSYEIISAELNFFVSKVLTPFHSKKTIP